MFKKLKVFNDNGQTCKIQVLILLLLLETFTKFFLQSFSRFKYILHYAKNLQYNFTDNNLLHIYQG